MTVPEELVLLPREQGDNKMTTYVAAIPLARRSSSPEAVPMATFTLVVASSGCSVAEAMTRAVRCNIPVGELKGDGEGAAVVDGVVRFLVAKIGHPTLRREVAEEAVKAAAHVRATTTTGFFAEEKLVDVEFWLVVILDDDDSESDERISRMCQEEEGEEEEEVGSDLESDEACWQQGASDGDHWQNVHYDDDPHQDDAEDGQFAARHYEREAEGTEPGTATLLMRGLELRMDGPEFDVQSEMTARDAHHLMRLAQRGGDFVSDPAFKRAFDGNTSVTPVPLAEVLEQTLERIMPKRSSGPVPRIMRTGF